MWLYSMKHERGRESLIQVSSTIPMSRGWTTPSSLVLKEMISMESKGQPGVALVASPLLSSQSSDLHGVFHVFLPRHREIAKWGVYSRFRSSRSRRVQDCIKTTLEGWDGAHHAVSMWDRMVSPLLVLVASPVDFFFSRFSISRKNDVAKSLGPFDVWKVLETQ
jgi:hypothetical protein